jgi:anaerobic selenocysteine-containing dehydrogenase
MPTRSTPTSTGTTTFPSPATNGGKVVTIAPAYSPSAIHADYHLPVRVGTDAALALAMCKVIVDAGLYQKRFVQEQTDLPLLVRTDTGRFLRGPEMTEGGREDQFFSWYTTTNVLTPAPRGALATAGVDPALEGRFEATLKDGKTIKVEPVFARLKRHLEDYTPGKAQKLIAGLIALRRLLAGDDPTMTGEMIQNRASQIDSELTGLGNTVPPAFA